MNKRWLSLLFIPIIASANTDEDFTNTPPSYFSYNGYIDGSYNYLVNSNKFTSGIFDRTFDIMPDGFTLHQFAYTISYLPPSGWGGMLDLVAGLDASIFSPYGFRSEPSPTTYDITPLQSFVQYATSGFSIDAGIFQSLAGFENMDPTFNYNFSQGNIGYGQPNLVVGIRTNYSPSPTYLYSVGIMNGWDSIRNTNLDKTAELGFTYTGSSLIFTADVYYGQQRIADNTATGPTGQRTLIDLISTYNLTNRLSFTANYDYGIQTKAALPDNVIGQAVWQAIAGYTAYKFADKWSVLGRGEIFYDTNGYRTGVAQTWDELTLTIGYNPVKNATIRAETRHDFSNVSSFVTKNNQGTSNYQQSYAIEAFYKF